MGPSLLMYMSGQEERPRWGACLLHCFAIFEGYRVRCHVPGWGGGAAPVRNCVLSLAAQCGGYLRGCSGGLSLVMFKAGEEGRPRWGAYLLNCFTISRA